MTIKKNSKTTTVVFENADCNRFFVTNWNLDRMAPIVSRSALDACDGVNEELCDRLNEMSEYLSNNGVKCAEIAAILEIALNGMGYAIIDRQY